MTHCSLIRVIVFVPALTWACAREVNDYPEPLGGEDAPVIGNGGSLSADAAGARAGSALTPLSRSEGGSGGVAPTASGSAGLAGKSAGLGGGVAMALPPADELGGAPGEDGGAPAAPAGSGGGGGGTGGSVASGGHGGSGAIEGCEGVMNWSPGSYSAGARVQSGINLYECKPYPYSGWCGMDAYAPGTGWAWADAWILVGPC